MCIVCRNIHFVYCLFKVHSPWFVNRSSHWNPEHKFVSRVFALVSDVKAIKKTGKFINAKNYKHLQPLKNKTWITVHIYIVNKFPSTFRTLIWKKIYTVLHLKGRWFHFRWWNKVCNCLHIENQEPCKLHIIDFDVQYIFNILSRYI